MHVVLVHGDAMGVLEDDGAGFRAVAWKYGDSYSFGTLMVLTRGIVNQEILILWEDKVLVMHVLYS